MFLYLLFNKKSGKFYIGVTVNICRRLEEHNLPNNHFTGRLKGVWEIVGYKFFVDKNQARKEEARLKRSKNKKYIFWYFNN